MLGLASLLVGAVALASANVLPVRPERKLADGDFLKRQKDVLDLFVGLGHHEHFKNEHSEWSIQDNIAHFADEKYPKQFLEAFKHSFFIPQDGIFSMACHHTMHDTIKLFDLFYFANDFNTFYKAASWARSHVNPSMFAYTYSLALFHRPDTREFVVPPLYEVFPNYFVPQETMHQVYDYKMRGVKEGRFNYNNSGWEYNYHGGMFGGPLSPDNRGYGDFSTSYFREDVGLNTFWAYWLGRNPSWMCPHKYGNVRFNRRGENFYYTIQQIFARYTLERLANGLPYIKILAWDKPIEVGYNPRVSYFNGQSMYARPDNFVPKKYNQRKIMLTEILERRIWDVVDAGTIWELKNQSLISLTEENGAEILGKIIYGTTDRPSRNYYKSLFFSGLDSLSYMISTGADRSYAGNALSTPMTAPRDPAFYNYLARLVFQFQHYKKTLGPYSHEELDFPGVAVKSVGVDRFLTYFDMYDYEVTNGVPMADKKDYIDHRYVARQYRLNHKPYRFNVTVESKQEGDGIVRVFLGAKYGPDHHILSVEQARLTFFEIDRFQVKLSPGVQVFERSSLESPIFARDQEGFRSLYNSINNAASQKEQFYYQEGGRCGFPARLQLPMGWAAGRYYRLGVVVSSFNSKESNHEADVACGGSRLYDGRAMGFPFDRPLHGDSFHMQDNFYFQDVPIYHKEAAELNRPSA